MGAESPFWYATKRFYADRLLSVQPRGDKLMLFACNDSDDVWSGEVTLQRLDFTGRVLAEDTVSLDVPERTTRSVLELPPTLVTPDNSRTELIVAQAGTERALWFFGRDKNLSYPSPDFGAELGRNGDAYTLTVTANNLLRDVAVFVDRLDPDATVSDQLVTLLPGGVVYLRDSLSKRPDASRPRRCARVSVCQFVKR